MLSNCKVELEDVSGDEREQHKNQETTSGPLQTNEKLLGNIR